MKPFIAQNYGSDFDTVYARQAAAAAGANHIAIMALVGNDTRKERGFKNTPRNNNI